MLQDSFHQKRTSDGLENYTLEFHPNTWKNSFSFLPTLIYGFKWLLPQVVWLGLGGIRCFSVWRITPAVSYCHAAASVSLSKTQKLWGWEKSRSSCKKQTLIHSASLSSGCRLDGIESADIFIQFTKEQNLFFMRKPVKNLAFKWISPSKQSGFDLTNFWSHNVLPIPSSLVCFLSKQSRNAINNILIFPLNAGIVSV